MYFLKQISLGISPAAVPGVLIVGPIADWQFYLLVHYNGRHFTTYQTDTQAQFVDMFGLDSKNVYACGAQWDSNQPIDSMYYYIFEYEGRQWKLTNEHIQTIGASDVPFPFGGLWGNTQNILFGINDDKVFTKIGPSEWSPKFDPPETIWKLHGTDINNIFIGGYWGTSIYHFNGQNWINFETMKTLNFSTWAIFCIKNQVYIGGINSYDRNAYVIRGKRKD